MHLNKSVVELFKENCSNVTINTENRFVSTGTFEVNFKNKVNLVQFTVCDVWGNYYVDIVANEIRALSNIKLLEVVDSIINKKSNAFDKVYTVIVSYDSVSQYYCDKLFPCLNEFERKLRKLMLNVYTINYNEQYFMATTDKATQSAIKGNVNGEKLIDKSNVAKEERYLKYGFYSLDYNDISNMLFTPTNLECDISFVENELSNIKDLSVLGDKEIRSLIDKYKPKSDWERIFGDKKIDESFQEMFDKIRMFRNNIAHCKFINSRQYVDCKKLLNKITLSLDEAIRISETKDFINKNQELMLKAIRNIQEGIGVFVKRLLNNIVPITEVITQQIEQVSLVSKTIIEAIESSDVLKDAKASTAKAIGFGVINSEKEEINEKTFEL